MRSQWETLPDQVRDAIQDNTGVVVKTERVSEGINSTLTLIAHTRSGPVFIKGSADNARAARALGREAAVNPFVTAVSPELLWQVDAAGWRLLGFEYIPGRRIDYSPGSPDIPKVTRTLTLLAEITGPDLPLPYLEARMANYTPTEELWRFTGNALLHTDLNPGNVRIVGDRAYLVDWAVPTRGVSWSDAADLVLCLITCGHTPADAEALATNIPTWSAADRDALDISVRSQEATWSDLYRTRHPDPWINATVAAARRWAQYRRGRQ